MVSDYKSVIVDEVNAQTTLTSLLADGWWPVIGRQGVVSFTGRGFGSSLNPRQTAPTRSFEVTLWKNSERLPTSVAVFFGIKEGAAYDAVLAQQATANREIIAREFEANSGGLRYFDVLFYGFGDSATWTGDFPNIPAAGTAQQAVPYPGAKANDAFVVSAPAAAQFTGVVYTAYTSTVDNGTGNGAVTIIALNNDGSAHNPGAGLTYTIRRVG